LVHESSKVSDFSIVCRATEAGGDILYWITLGFWEGLLIDRDYLLTNIGLEVGYLAKVGS